MKNAKRTLKIAGIVCLVASLLGLADVVSDIIFYDAYWLYLIDDGYTFLASLVTGIIYLSMQNKDNEYLASHKKLFMGLLIINIFNGIIVWLISFWVEITISELSKIKFYSNVKYNQGKPQDGQDTIVIEPSDYEVTSKVELLEKELEKLDELKRKKMITDEEYEKLKKDLLEKFM